MAAWTTHTCVFDTDIGACGVAWSEAGITRFQLPEVDRDATEERLRTSSGASEPGSPPPAIARAIVDLQRYFAGERVEFTSIAVDLAGVAPFFCDVYEAARRIGWGETTTYGDLAHRVGVPGAARGVGQALSRNPVAVIIPCHRILASGNKIGGFSAFGGTVSKQRLLALEGVQLGRDGDRRQLSLFEQW